MRPVRRLFTHGLKAAILPLLTAMALTGCSIGPSTSFNITGNWFMYIIGSSGSLVPQIGSDIQVGNINSVWSFSQADTTISGNATDGSTIAGTATNVTVTFTVTEPSPSNAVYTFNGTTTGTTMYGSWYLNSDTSTTGTWAAIVNNGVTTITSGITWHVVYTDLSTGATDTAAPTEIEFVEDTTTGALSGPINITNLSSGITGNISGSNVIFWWEDSDGNYWLSTGTVTSATDMSGSGGGLGFFVSDASPGVSVGTWTATTAQ